MKTKIFILSAVLIFAFQTTVEADWNVVINPPYPTTSDIIELWTGGTTSNPVIGYDYSIVTIQGNNLQWDFGYNIGMIAIPSDWSVVETIGPLSAGTYNLTMNAAVRQGDYYFEPAIKYESFTVTPEPSTVTIFAFALPFIRAFSKRKN